MNRVGFGYDLHNLAKGYNLTIGGIAIESEFGAYSYSDGDCLLHALVDAMLGASGLGDIGEYFPDNDLEFKNKESSFFVIETLKLIRNRGFNVINIDATILLEKPKLSLYKSSIRDNIGRMLDLDASFINIKAKTNERIGAIGNSLAIASYVVVLLED